MKVEFINPFINSGTDIVAQLIGGDTEQGQLAIRLGVVTTQPVSIVIQVTQQIEGFVVYGMSSVTATKIAGAMMNAVVVTLDEMAMSALSELGNIITSHATRQLVEAGYQCEIAPPTTVQGLHVEIAPDIPTLLVPLFTRCGKIEIAVGLIEQTTAAA